MDHIDRKIVEILSGDSRRPLAEIGSVVGLAPSSVNERIRRLGAAGVVRRFTIEADSAALGLPVLVFVWIALREDAGEQAFRDFIAGHRKVLECHHVTGRWSYLVKLRLAATTEIEGFLAELKDNGFLGRSETVLALSSPVPDCFVATRGE